MTVTYLWMFFVLLTSFCFLLSGIEYLYLDIQQKNKFSWKALLFFGSSLVLLFPGPSAIKILPCLTLILTSHSFGRPFNGGSDSLLFWLSFVFILEWLFPNSSHSVLLTFIAFVSAWTYFYAGWVKTKNGNWKNRHALNWSFQQGCYDRAIQTPESFQWLAPVIFFLQLSVPLALISQKYAVIVILFFLVFHFINIYILGLNRFFWVWLATYPGLYHASEFLVEKF